MGPLYPRAKGRDHEILRALEKHPKAIPCEIELQFCNGWAHQLIPMVPSFVSTHLFMVGLMQNLVDNGTLFTCSRVGRHVDFSFIKASMVPCAFKAMSKEIIGHNQPQP